MNCAGARFRHVSIHGRNAGMSIDWLSNMPEFLMHVTDVAQDPQEIGQFDRNLFYLGSPS